MTAAQLRHAARAHSAVLDAQSHITQASGAVRVAADCPVAEIPAALDAAQTELLAAWEALAYAVTELGGTG